MKRFTAIAAAAVLGAGSLAWGAYPPSTSAPAGYPPTVQAAAAQPPAGYVRLQAAPRVQVFPFESVGGAANLDWVGRGLQQSLQTDVSHSGATLIIAGAALPPHTTPLEAAKASLASYAVTGTYQVQGDQVRADGQLIDVSTGQPVGGFSAKAPLNSVFQMEDAMGTQLQRLLPPDRSAMPVAAAYDVGPGAQPLEAAQPTITVLADPTPAVSDSSPVNVYYSGAPDYDNSPYYNGYGGAYYGGYDYPYVSYYSPFAFGYYGGFGGYRGYGYGHGYGYGRGTYGRGYGGLRPNPTFYNPVNRGGRGYVLNGSGGRSYGYGSRFGTFGGLRSNGFSVGARSGFSVGAHAGFGGGGIGGRGFGGGHR